MKILFFGASVTAQSRNHATQSITGYVTYLDEKLANYDYSVSRVAYSSSQYSNMGLYGLGNAILAEPNVIFFEWHTTGESSINVELLLRQQRILSSMGILMILLVLPSKRHSPSDNLQKYAMIPLVDLPCLDLRYLSSEAIHGEFLRDEVHTNEIGAQLYASAIDLWIRDNLLSAQTVNSQYSLSSLNRYSYDEHGVLLYREIKIETSLRVGHLFHLSLNQDASIIYSFVRGPLCPDIAITSSSMHGDRVERIVDQWSYYNRESCGIEMIMRQGEQYVIAPVDRLPDIHSICPRASEPENLAKLASSTSDLVLFLKSVYVPVLSLLSVRHECS